jgi:hypothetical protein
MYEIIDNRTFWIYFIVTFIFIVIGTTFILNSDNYYKFIIMFIWMISNVLLLCLVYHSSYLLSPLIKIQPSLNSKNLGNQLSTNIYKDCCVIDSDSKCLEPKNRIWLYINILYIILLILSTVWATECNNLNAKGFLTCSGVIIILGGLLLSSYSGNDIIYNPSIFSIGHLTIWICLSIYVAIKLS